MPARSKEVFYGIVSGKKLKTIYKTRGRPPGRMAAAYTHEDTTETHLV